MQRVLRESKLQAVDPERKEAAGAMGYDKKMQCVLREERCKYGKW